jgi:Lrp/AsnC family transcriptional regulator for asnA, asnC and gidA
MKKKTLDQTDYQILHLLIEDANTSYVDIAKKIYISAATVHVRIKNLRAMGIIKSAHTTVDLAALGYNITAFVGIYLERSVYYTDVLLALKELPEVTNVHFITGEYNIFAKVICKDTQHLHDLLNNDIQELKGIQRTESFLSLDEPISRGVALLPSDVWE